MNVDVLVVGGGLGGVAAALAAVASGCRVALTEETDWLGGQLTTQLVPPDEHPWIEKFGSSRSYRKLRSGIRNHYRRSYPLTERSRDLEYLNPGAGRVGPLCHEPRATLNVIHEMLAPHEASGKLTVLREHAPVSADTDGDVVRAVTLRNIMSAETLTITASYVLDATETGELLPLTGTEYAHGAESIEDTGEPNAAAVANPDNMQAVSVCFAMSHHPGEDFRIDRPSDYDHWRSIAPTWWHGPQFGWVAPHPHTLDPRHYQFTPNPDDNPATILADQSKDSGADELWTFRRILARHHYVPGAFDSDITIVNWPMIDYLGGPVFGGSEDENERHVAAARAQSRSFFYWLQTDAPRVDGGTGWPGLRLRPDVTGTPDGFAKRPYYRESRRILGQYRIVEQDLAVAQRETGSQQYWDSVGVGSYRIDLHPSTGGDNYIDVPAWPFEIPLRALVPVRMKNVLAAAKNISTTHITNGCYRVHPVEWVVGEAAGNLAAYCVQNSIHPHQVTASQEHVEDFQRRLEATGVETRWPNITYY